MVLFGIFSILCGLSTSIGMLVVMRVFQGLAGGPLMPLSQTLMLASANFIAVLNMTIANVAVPNIAGALGAAASQAPG